MSDGAPLVMFVRPWPGSVGERDWAVHVVPVPDPDAMPKHLVAYCGRRFKPGTTELLNGPHGVPCVARAPMPTVDQVPDANP